MPDHRIHLEWGPQGALASCRPGDLAVVVDVLSFTTTLTVALDAGIEVYPYPFKDESALGFAREHGATLAVGRFEARLGTAGATVSLSPASMRSAAGLARVVLPSPNGSALARTLRDHWDRVAKPVRGGPLDSRFSGREREAPCHGHRRWRALVR
jgi:2-phosphosulfolactate phosphatase